MNRIHAALLVCGAIIIGAAAAGCVEVVQATDCRWAAPPCGIIVVDTHDMTSIPVTVPVSAIP
jgi:hypothetical protein